MSVLDDLLKQAISPLMPQDFKFGPILGIYVIREIQTSSFQCIKSLKKKLEVITLWNIPGENVKLFTSQFLQTCLDFGKNVPSQQVGHANSWSFKKLTLKPGL